MHPRGTPSGRDRATSRWFASQIEQKGIEAFLPTVTRWSRWKDRRKSVDWPLFPGYCFARFEPTQRLSILKCAGVVSIVSFDGDIAAIPDFEIDGIRRLVDERAAIRSLPVHLARGRWSKSSHGPLKGVVGRLLRKGAHARLVLAVDLIGQAVSVEVDAADVRAY